jgi:hypothetical protein
MSQSAITTAFEDYLTQQVASGGVVTLDRFIFANVPDLDPDAPIDRGEQIPVDYIVYQQDVTLPGVINSNEVVYSVTMGTEVGDFDFNWIGLVNSTTSLLAMVTHAPVQQKFKNADGQQGNTLTRSFLMEYDGAATATTITTPAETWQIDFTARLAGMDDRQRLENMDIYGYGAFFGDGYLVWGNPTDGYTIDAGVGYVSGLRVQLDADQSLNVTEKPINVYVDACWKGTLTSTWYVEQQITLASDLSNYTDPDGTAHYVFAVASIDVNGAVTDLRPSGSKDNQALSGYLQTKNNLGEIADAGAEAQTESRGNIGCGTAAALDATTSTTDNTVGHVLKVGDHGVGNDALLAVDTALSSPTGCPSGFFKQSGNDADNRYASYGTGVNLQYAVTEDEGTYYGRVFVRHDGHLIAEWIHVNTDGTIAEQYVNELYGALNKPTATDTGALPITGGNLFGQLGFVFQDAREDAGCLIDYFDANGMIACGYGYYQDRFDIHFYDEEGNWESNPLSIGRNGNATVSGNLSGAAVFEGNVRVYSPNNPPPATDLSAYATTSWVSSYFLQGVRLSASHEVAYWSSQTSYDDGSVLTSLWLDGGSQNDGGLFMRYIQQNINGNWVNVAVL